jgi:DNA repair protein SbcD/Mre11
VRIIHTSDTHLGFAAYSRLDGETGINLRETDVYHAFEQVVDYAVSKHVDAVVHAGDLFDGVRPNNRAIAFLFRQLSRLLEAKIPFVVVAGNHSTPRQLATGSIFEILAFFPNVRAVYRGNYEQVRLGDAVFHAIPHSHTQELLQANLAAVELDTKARYNVFLTHTALSGRNEYAGGEFGEQRMPFAVLRPDFTYCALGHYHKYLKIASNAYYCGSTERLSFDDAGLKKGFLDVDLDSIKINFVPLNTRRMVDFAPLECSALSAEEIVHHIESLPIEQIRESICRITLQNLPRHVYVSLNFERIRELTREAVYFEPRFEWAEDSRVSSASGSIGALADEFEAHLQSQQLPASTRKRLQSLGLKYLRSAEETEEEET